MRTTYFQEQPRTLWIMKMKSEMCLNKYIIPNLKHGSFNPSYCVSAFACGTKLLFTRLISLLNDLLLIFDSNHLFAKIVVGSAVFTFPPTTCDASLKHSPACAPAIAVWIAPPPPVQRSLQPAAGPAPSVLAAREARRSKPNPPDALFPSPCPRCQRPPPGDMPPGCPRSLLPRRRVRATAIPRGAARSSPRPPWTRTPHSIHASFL